MLLYLALWPTQWQNDVVNNILKILWPLLFLIVWKPIKSDEGQVTDFRSQFIKNLGANFLAFSVLIYKSPFWHSQSGYTSLVYSVDTSDLAATSFQILRAPLVYNTDTSDLAPSFQAFTNHCFKIMTRKCKGWNLL